LKGASEVTWLLVLGRTLHADRGAVPDCERGERIDMSGRRRLLLRPLRVPTYGAHPGLLDHVRHLVGKKASALNGVGEVTVPAKSDVVAARVGPGTHSRRGTACKFAGVDMHRAEVVLQAFLHEGAGLFVERLPRALRRHDLSWRDASDRRGRRR